METAIASGGEQPEHFAVVGEGSGGAKWWSTYITQPTRDGGGWPVVTLTLSGRDGCGGLTLELLPTEARSVAAMLVRAADLIELGT